jgi:outer membrane biogenesis lipoprotein LolB
MKLLLVFFSLLLVGCAAHTWTRPNTTEEEMQHDREQCERDTKAVGGEFFFFERCMLSKGYSEQ